MIGAVQNTNAPPNSSSSSDSKADLLAITNLNVDPGTGLCSFGVIIQDTFSGWGCFSRLLKAITSKKG